MQTESLFELVYVLLDRKTVTARELSGRFGVSVRTIHRWVEALSVAGIPVYAVQGKGGGIRIAEDFALDKAVLSESERLAVVAAVNALNSLSLGTEEGTLSKLRPLADGRNTDWLQIDFAPWNPKGAEVRALFETLKRSILRGRQVAFDYFPGSGNFGAAPALCRRTVQPWKLVFRSQAWYLFGWCNTRKEARYFKLNRMRGLRGLSSPVTMTQDAAPPGPHPAAYREQGLRSDALVPLTLKVQPPAVHLLLDEYKAERAEVQADGSVLVSIAVPDFVWLPERLLGFGTAVEVLAPAGLRAEVAALARRVAALYGTGTPCGRQSPVNET